MESLRIAIQIERFHPGQGGAEGYARSLAAGLKALGQDVTVIASEGSDPPAGVRLLLLALPRHPKAVRALLFARRSARAAREGRYDIVHAMGKSLGMNILNPHGGVEAVWLARERRSHSGRLGRALWAARRRLSPRHHVIHAVLRRQYRDSKVLRYIALSRSIGDAMARVHGVDRARIVILPNRVDRERFRPSRDSGERVALRRRLGVPLDRLAFLFVGNNFRLKGLGPLVEALGALRREAPPFVLLVLGRGDIPRFRRLAGRAGAADVVDFRGPVGGIEDWYRAADGYFHPTFYDACSLALPEAMASGLPVLASIHDGSAEAITDGVNGVLVREPDDIPVLLSRLRLFFDPSWRLRIGAAARALNQEEASPGPAADVLRIYREALAGLSPNLAQD